MRIAIISSRLSAGGVERVVSLQAQGLQQRGHAVSVITLGARKTDFFILPQEIVRVALDLARNSHNVSQAIRNNLQRLRALRQAVTTFRPDAVISHDYQPNVLTALALVGTGIPLVAVEHIAPDLNVHKIWEKLRRLTYPWVARVVSVSCDIDLYFSWLPKKKRAVINNPVSAAAMNQGSGTTLPVPLTSDQKLITAMGRLTHQKGFDLLLQAFNKIISGHPQWQLMILGEGELRKDLERQRYELGLAKRVFFPGAVLNPFPILRSSDLFAMASRYEGFPCALLEAMACGLPAIHTDCQSGPGEIIRQGIDGLLVPNGDVAALSGAMNRLMSDSEERQRLASRAPEVLERFGFDGAIAQWESLVVGILNGTGGGFEA